MSRRVFCATGLIAPPVPPERCFNIAKFLIPVRNDCTPFLFYAETTKNHLRPSGFPDNKEN